MHVSLPALFVTLFPRAAAPILVSFCGYSFLWDRAGAEEEEVSIRGKERGERHRPVGDQPAKGGAESDPVEVEEPAAA